jgi:hypothetical protein
MHHDRPYEPKRTTSRYFNPPHRIQDIGRRLVPGEFDRLARQISETEVIVARYDNSDLQAVASHIDGQERLNQIFEECLREADDSYAPIDYYAVKKEDANSGMKPPIP